MIARRRSRTALSRSRYPLGADRASAFAVGRPWPWATGLVGCALGGAACSSDPGVTFGPPGGLSGKVLPQPTLSGGSSTPADAGAAPDAETVVAAGDAGVATGALDASPCAVSWSAQIFPNMAATGKWKCGDSSCHGGFQSPKVTSDPRGTYAAFAAFTMTPPAPAVPFVRAGSTTPSQSGIECNLSSTACGAQMPLTQTGAQALTAAEVTMLDTWVRCGAPNN